VVDRVVVFGLFTWQYLLMVFMAGLGVIQIAAVRSRREHLWLTRSPTLSAALGTILLIAGVALYFLEPLFLSGPWGPAGPDAWGTASWQSLPAARAVNDTRGGLAGYFQALWFAIGFIAAATVAWVCGRLRRRVRS